MNDHWSRAALLLPLLLSCAVQLELRYDLVHTMGLEDIKTLSTGCVLMFSLVTGGCVYIMEGLCVIVLVPL